MSWTDLTSWLITAIVVATLLAFVGYLLGLRALPLEERPRTPIYDRLGKQIGVSENPDYHVNPGEEEAVEPPGTPPEETLQGGGREPGA